VRFTGKSIIVTGAGSGIGRAAATLFAAEGGQVVVADKVGAEATAAAIREAGHTAQAIEMDAGNEEDVLRTIALACDSFGGLDIMFANAGISGGMANIFNTDVSLFSEVLRVNLIGPFLAIKHGAPRIAERGGGAIILTASVAGIRSGAGSPAYSASKAGVINLAQVSAQQLSGSNVRVNAICPGLTETGMTQSVFDYAREAGTIDRVGRSRRNWPRWRCSLPRMMQAMSTDRRWRWMVGCRPAIRLPSRNMGAPAPEWSLPSVSGGG
jgi:NAD(P)-dependent dehydrogenase (short-subunit alcohol dehydrogenase family)